MFFCAPPPRSRLSLPQPGLVLLNDDVCLSVFHLSHPLHLMVKCRALSRRDAPALYTKKLVLKHALPGGEVGSVRMD